MDTLRGPRAGLINPQNNCVVQLYLKGRRDRRDTECGVSRRGLRGKGRSKTCRLEL